ncbi:dethiobiotin synthase [Haloarcula nitratireducens]|uniref:ATP-dependent dethiobiotin synthetase BioD n=1 Tax=Haloarcula nitratireducens TaxID=2487749 RepID=A0AAW4P8D5_9EURY|nr:dethiobiotin synthase [Halomicroarcula nitratireducens]MBX0294164.1 dethiobiotin synthase [Halomicroarcula nitratireducens]
MSDESTGGDADGLFVVGTDTGVGKTVVTAGLTGWLRERGRDAIAVKPCQTGYPPDDDAGFVAEACGSEEAATCLRRLEPPLAPAVAADRTDADLSYDEIRDGVEAAISAHETAVVEGIGGLRVPLADDRDVLDLVADVGLPAIVVARSGLGTLNHTCLTVDALRNRGVSVRGIVLNEYEGATTAERTNPEVLEDMTDRPVWPLPPLSLSDPSAAVDGVREHLPLAVFGSG